MRALIIEDDPSVGAAIQMILGREGFDAVHAPEAETGIQLFESSSFNLVIVDIFMPGMDGLKTIAEFRNRAPTIPILAISGFRFREPMDRGLDFLGMADEAGATFCLRKPFTSGQLITAVRASLDPSHSGISCVETEFRDKDSHDDVERPSLQHRAAVSPAL
jgi:DNA-binding response OmpR family regulator